VNENDLSVTMQSQVIDVLESRDATKMSQISSLPESAYGTISKMVKIATNFMLELSVSHTRGGLRFILFTRENKLKCTFERNQTRAITGSSKLLFCD
jgi:hypothetical protein